MGRDTNAEPSLKVLVTARDNVQREIDILAGGAPLYGRNRDVQVGGLIGELTSTLHDLAKCIAEWDSTDADRT